MTAEPSELRVLSSATEAPDVSGRVRHDQKITVYVSADELHALELARLHLARTFGLRVDRGRLVREAVAHALADLEARGARGVLVQRLNDR